MMLCKLTNYYAIDNYLFLAKKLYFIQDYLTKVDRNEIL